MHPCFPPLHLLLAPQFFLLQTRGSDAGDGIHEQRNQHITHFPIGTSLASRASSGNNVIFLCCSAVSADAEVLTDCSVSLCHLRARFRSENVMLRSCECRFSLWVNAIFFTFHLSLLQRFMYRCRLNMTYVLPHTEHYFCSPSFAEYEMKHIIL